MLDTKNGKSEIIADIQNKIQFPKTLLDSISKGKTASKEQIELGIKELEETERLLKLLD